jgi:uncharacterized protein YbaR (Trm112 family)
MALDPFVLSVIEDPIDHQPLSYIAGKNVLYNPRRRVVYEVRGAIAVLLPDEARPVTEEEHEQFTSDPTATTTGTPL